MALGYPWWVRATHFFNFLFITLLLRSGIEILGAHPKLYGDDDAIPGSEWVRFGDRERAPADETAWTSEDESQAYTPWIALPGRDNLGLGRHWHFWGAVGWAVAGGLYVVVLIATPQWQRVVPTSWTIVPAAWEALLTYLQFQVPEAGGVFNPLQKLTYFLVVFVLSPLQIATGVAMAPAARAHFPAVFSGLRQKARSLHFFGLLAFAAFIVVHLAMVVYHGVGAEMAKIVLGSEEASHELAITLGVGGIAAVVAFHVAATYYSLRSPRAVKRLLERGVEPLIKLLFHHRVETVEDVDRVSGFARVHGRVPRNDTYQRHRANDFEDWTLTVDGLVEDETEWSLDDLRTLPERSQTTRHDCVQGWTYYAQWAGVPVSELLERCEPQEEAAYLVFHSLDEKWEYPDVDEYYYEGLDLEKATEPGTILAHEMNGEPLPAPHGAPLRLRIESQLGYKMVKWVTRIEVVADVDDVGEGEGGWSEDVLHYSGSGDL